MPVDGPSKGMLALTSAILAAYETLLVVAGSRRSDAGVHGGHPLLFPPPRSTRNWPSRAVLGERVWAARDTADIPEQFRSTSAANASYAFQLVGVAALAYGLVVLDPITTVTGLVLVQCAKVWFLDRMVLLFADVVPRDPKYASWDY